MPEFQYKPEPKPEPMPEPTPVPEPKLVKPRAEINCPNCKTIIDADSEACWACGERVDKAATVKEESKPEPKQEPKPEPKPEPKAEPKPEPKAEEPKQEEHTDSGDAKKSVSIRKIIKRK
jgi:protein TonB